MSNRLEQRGASGIGLILLLVILAYGVYVGLQYVPQYIESATVGTVLDTVAAQHREERFRGVDEVRNAIEKQLYVNEKNDLKNSFTVVPSRGGYLVTVRYERELDLLFEKKLLPYEKTLALD